MVAILYGVGFVMEPVFLCLSENGCNERNSRFLDLCCGAGYNSQHIQNSGYEVVGIDFSEESLLIVREKRKREFVDGILACDESIKNNNKII